MKIALIRFIARCLLWLLRLLPGTTEIVSINHNGKVLAAVNRDAYDPAQDDEKILKGEVESYFE